MRFLMLGPLDVVGEGGLTVRAAKHRSLLAALLVEANRLTEPSASGWMSPRQRAFALCRAPLLRVEGECLYGRTAPRMARACPPSQQ